QEYRQAQEEMKQLGQPLNELFEEEINADQIFESLRSNQIQLSEISALIFALNWFGDLQILQEIKGQWQQLNKIQSDQSGLLRKALGPKPITQYSAETPSLNSRWTTHQDMLMAKVEAASMGIKQIGLWISVLLGILIVLIGVVVSVRAVKSIGRWEKSLHEKEVLLSEIHHRVKNNLAVISGLLELESMQNRNPEQALKESRDRIHSMAMIHEILYQSHNFSEIRLDYYINELSEYVCDTYAQSGQNIGLSANLEPVVLNINQAVPAGLILNELMANAIEHGFKEQSEGEIAIHLEESEGTVRLLLRNNGQALPEEFNLETTTSTGFAIVKALVSQLNGQLRIKNTEAPAIVLQFSKSDASGSSNRYF
ncbi:MAG TPA: sensor histidine kinase, partial [Bacteroidales bacterium]|nr:sensor histidine kinase [Bacteroidales bacterium]